MSGNMAEGMSKNVFDDSFRVSMIMGYPQFYPPAYGGEYTTRSTGLDSRRRDSGFDEPEDREYDPNDYLLQSWLAESEAKAKTISTFWSGLALILGMMTTLHVTEGVRFLGGYFFNVDTSNIPYLESASFFVCWCTVLPPLFSDGSTTFLLEKAEVRPSSIRSSA
ncbi:hypothetical protein SAICODRAFT_206074 [Saitoella complicata NRRL Y-17804]|uniref:uncharacterized protein n=1 Tax=Saitoella complicata (strain BCRC 22490 / CBS 7301 / JCM 7358 / NBRC 10748 / NRRL Y-17804) TaxID=698492 RepID=UPI000866B674|nr:uncharacterized protein SAICODRAFT_206074 [Saitoella complicata NRRL Y-17804]ODQ54790.1 hypothetical protein SAICODRAFT_206074 [Saitoella complicata NRRL Y-17804]